MLRFVVALAAISCLVPGSVWGRGFGGFHGGFSGSMGRGAVSAPSMSRGSMGSGFSGMRAPTRSPSMGASPSRGLSAPNFNSGQSFRNSGQSPLDSGQSLRDSGQLPRDSGQNFNSALSSRAPADRSQLNQFLGLPSDAGAQNVGANHIGANQLNLNNANANNLTRNNVNVNNINRDNVNDLNRANVNDLNRVETPGLATRPLTPYAQGFRRVSPEVRRDQGALVRTNFTRNNLYTDNWYTDHPGAWRPYRWAAGSAWAAASWYTVEDWFGYGASAPVMYNYGDNMYVNQGQVYQDGQSVGSEQDYAQQANQLADSGAQAGSDSSQGDWLSLGVFAIADNEQAAGDTQNQNVIQLAVNKQGTIRGNYTPAGSDNSQTVQGSVDKQTQRVVWTIGDDTNTVYDTGLYNLTRPETQVLVHTGSDQTEQKLLVQIKKGADSN